MGDSDETINEDQWLYGEGGEAGPGVPEGADPPPAVTNGDVPPPGDEAPNKSPEPPQPSAEEPPPFSESEKEESDLPKPPGEEDIPLTPTTTEPAPPGEGSPKEGEEEGEEDDDEDDSDDDVRVTIGDIKTAPPQYANLNKVRGAVLSSGIDKLSKQPGKFSIEEFESIGTINGYPAHEFSIDALEEKPWRKPGSDITDYFNYGFNEDTWRAYCERQKTLRIHESGVGLGGLGVPRNSSLINVMSDGSKYLGGGGISLNVPPPMIPSAVIPARKPPPLGPMPVTRRPTSVIDVIGGGIASRRTTDSPPKENVIQVMTSDRRDFRKSFDLTVPPPGFDAPPPGVAPPVIPNYPPHGGYGADYYGEVDYYGTSYEPTQEVQSWGGEVRSARHRGRRSTRGSSLSPHSKRSDRHSHGGSVSKDELPGGITIKQEPIDKGYKDRERDRERSERHKDRHRHRSRSRSPDRERRSSRKHKSRSRSPGHRSHKKKKSKKSDKRDTGSD